MGDSPSQPERYKLHLKLREPSPNRKKSHPTSDNKSKTSTVLRLPVLWSVVIEYNNNYKYSSSDDDQDH